MAIAVYFHTKNMTLQGFNDVHARLAAAGAAAPPGRLHHSCFGEDGDLMVYDVWDSSASFEAFGAMLMPILEELGIDPGEPSIMTLQHLDQREAVET